MSGARLSSLALLFACTLAGFRPAGASTADSTVYLVAEVMHEAFLPSAIRFAPDGRLFQLELWTGDIRVFPDTLASSASTVWAHLPVITDGERGLLGFDFHPDYPDSPYVYFLHSDPADTASRIVRLRDTGNAGVDPVVNDYRMCKGHVANCDARFGLQACASRAATRSKAYSPGIAYSAPDPMPLPRSPLPLRRLLWLAPVCYFILVAEAAGLGRLAGALQNVARRGFPEDDSQG